ncbi:MAG: hypothetical protein JXR51_10665 [Bacteroidales bacterium]|nr:hypothetical protein [Bacteroidales bacterium]MBN2757629.1 hypothetical protein [Bacteroidales bacterium]
MITKRIQLKYFFISVILIFIGRDIFAQKNLKYKNVYKTVVEESKEGAYSLLLVFQKQEPYFANTYLQLGLIAEFWAKDYDALVEKKDVEFFIYNTNLYFGLAKSKIDDKEVRKNQKYYENVGKFKDLQKIQFEDIDALITDKIAANNEYKKNVNIVTNYFNSSIKHYNNCISIFKEINQKNNKIKDIYMTADEDFMKKLNELESSFDSTLYFLQNYQTAVKNYPIKNYNQKYKLLPIDTYRLQGLTGSDFLLDLIPIWDYGTWIKSLKKLMKSDLFQLRNEIDITEKALNRNVDKLLNMNDYAFGIEKYHIDEKLKYQIGKYDHKSLVLELFNYKDSKLDYLILARNPLNNPSDSVSNFPLSQKAKYFYSLIKKNKETDTLINNFKSKVNLYDVNKYKEFFDDNYGGFEGLKNFTTKESEFLNTSLNNYYDNLGQSVINDILVKKDSISFIYNKSEINLKISDINFDNVEIEKYYTKAYIIDSYGDYYITGTTKLKNKINAAFIAKSNGKKDIEWVKTFYADKISNSYGAFIQANENGCDILITSIKDNNIENELYKIDYEGKLKIKKSLNVAFIPRYFRYDEINDNYLIGFKGLNMNSFIYEKEEKSLISKFKGEDLSLIWTSDFDLTGNIVDIIKVNTNFLVILNFSAIKSAEKVINSETGTKNNTCIAILDENGKLIEIKPFFNANSYYITRAIKINNKTINLLGFNGDLIDYNKSKINSFGKINYILIDDKVEMIFNNWKK